ncbi:S-adenosylmethionine decarboxylase [Rhizobium sp. RAF56]|uniref:S-adenosylmethionine decarboxylase n=1 Tax=Rhizobium sp. RAF56 TaxID=3233062 RepID=UPI003F99966A
MKEEGKNYGKELIIDLHDCNPAMFKRAVLKRFFQELCELIGMQRSKLTWWDDYKVPVAKRQTEPHLKGTSAVQFIMTSSITVHALDLLGKVYVNIFSCKDFDRKKAAEFCRKFFGGKIARSSMILRR